MKKLNIIIVYALFVVGFLTTQYSYAKPHEFADDVEDCIRTLNQITLKAENNCSAVDTEDIAELSTACFCAPVQGNSPDGSCSNTNQSTFTIISNDYGAFFETNLDGCYSDRYIETNPLTISHVPNFCTTSVTKSTQYNTKISNPNAWLHKTTYIDDSGTEVSMDKLRERLLAVLNKPNTCTVIKKIFQSFKDESVSNYLYVADSDNIFFNSELRLGNQYTPAIILGKNINIDQNHETVGHFLASNEVTITSQNTSSGGIQANKISYTLETNDVKQRMMLKKEYVGACIHCHELQAHDTTAYRLSQISGQNACEEVVLQLQQCSNHNTECTPYTDENVLITVTNNTTSKTITPNNNGLIYVNNAIFNSNFLASLKIDNESTDIYCDHTTSTESQECSFTGAQCNASVQDIAGYIGEQTPVTIMLDGNVLTAFKAFDDNTTNNSQTALTVKLGLRTNQDISLTSQNGETHDLKLTGDTSELDAEISLPNAIIDYDKEKDITTIKSNIIINTLALNLASLNKETKLTYLKIEAQLLNTTTPNNIPKTFFIDFENQGYAPKIKSAPIAFCVDIDNSEANGMKQYVLQSEKDYPWHYKAVGCTQDVCFNDQNKTLTQSDLHKLCAGSEHNEVTLPSEKISDLIHVESLQPLYKTTFKEWLKAPSSKTAEPVELSDEGNLTKPYVALEAIVNDHAIELGFIGNSYPNNPIHLTENGWVSFSTFTPLNSIPERKTYFYSPIYTVVPSYLYPTEAQFYNYYLLTDSEDITTVPVDLAVFTTLNNNTCPQYYNEHFLMRLGLNGMSINSTPLKNIRGALVDNSQNEFDFTGFSIKSKDENELVANKTTNVPLTEETSFQKYSTSTPKIPRIFNWQETFGAENEVQSSLLVAYQKLNLPSTLASPKTVFMAIVSRSVFCIAPQDDTEFTCNYPVYTKNDALSNEDDQLNTFALQTQIKNFYGLDVLPTLTGINSLVKGLTNTSLWKNHQVTFLHLTKNTGPILKNISNGRLVSIPVTTSANTLYMPFTVQSLDENGNWIIRQDKCTSLNLTKQSFMSRTLEPNIFFKTTTKDSIQTDENGILELPDNQNVVLSFCEGDKTNCNKKVGTFVNGVLYLKATNNASSFTNDSYGLLNFKFNPQGNDNKTIEHLLNRTTSKGGFLFKEVKNNVRIINKTIK